MFNAARAAIPKISITLALELLGTKRPNKGFENVTIVLGSISFQYKFWWNDIIIKNRKTWNNIIFVRILAIAFLYGIQSSIL